MRRLREWAAPLAGLGVIGMAGGLLLAAYAPELRPFAVPTLAVAALMLALAGVASLGGLADAVKGRRGRLSGVSIASAVAALAAAGAVNALAGASGVSWDFTATRQFELAPQTAQALAALEADVAVTGFAVESDEREQRYRAVAEGYLRRFAREAGGRLRYEFVDPEARPSAARSLGVTDSPALIFTSPAAESPVALGGGSASAGASEQELLTAILRVSRSRRHAVYFLEGHGERAINDLRADGAGVGFAAAGLRNDGHRVESLDLGPRGAVPDDASLLVVAAPAAPIPPDEERAIAEWLDGGGQALLMMEPSAESRGAMRGLLARWGVEALPGAVVDPERSVPGDPRTLTARREQYPSGAEVTAGSVVAAPLGPTLFPWAAAFRPLPEAADRIERGAPLPMRFEPLVATSSSARAEGGGAPGTLTLHLLLQASAPFDPDAEQSFDPAGIRTRLAIFGDADFASNRYYGETSNADLFLNAANWLLRDEALIAVRPKQEVFRPLTLTASEFNLVRYVSWFLLPASVAAAGVVAWRRRR